MVLLKSLHTDILSASSYEEGGLLPHLKVKSTVDKPNPFAGIFSASLLQDKNKTDPWRKPLVWQNHFKRKKNPEETGTMYRAQKTFKLKNPGVIREDIQNSNRIHEKAMVRKIRKSSWKLKIWLLKFNRRVEEKIKKVSQN